MNTDKFNTFLSVFIRVHPWLIFFHTFIGSGRSGLGKQFPDKPWEQKAKESLLAGNFVTGARLGAQAEFESLVGQIPDIRRMLLRHFPQGPTAHDRFGAITG